jgi:hypothetical protein
VKASGTRLSRTAAQEGRTYSTRLMEHQDGSTRMKAA